MLLFLKLFEHGFRLPSDSVLVLQLGLQGHEALLELISEFPLNSRSYFLNQFLLSSLLRFFLLQSVVQLHLHILNNGTPIVSHFLSDISFELRDELLELLNGLPRLLDPVVLL